MQGGVGGGREGVGRNLIYSTYFSDVFTTIGIVKITQHVNLTKSAPCFQENCYVDVIFLWFDKKYTVHTVKDIFSYTK